MKGYKGTDKDMRCRGMQYEVGKTFHADGKIEVCDNGLHFCIRLTDVFDYYEHDNGNRFFEVEADGIIDSDGKKSAASELTIIRSTSVSRMEKSCAMRTSASYTEESPWG